MLEVNDRYENIQAQDSREAEFTRSIQRLLGEIFKNVRFDKIADVRLLSFENKYKLLKCLFEFREFRKEMLYRNRLAEISSQRVKNILDNHGNGKRS